MKDQELLMDAMNEIDDDLIEEARTIPPRRTALHWAAAAAVFVIVLGSILIPLTNSNSPSPSTPILQIPNLTDPTLQAPIPSEPTLPTPPPTDPADIIVPDKPVLSAPGFEEGIVGSTSEGGSTANAEVRPRYVNLTAKAVRMLPDTYYITGQRSIKFRLVQMEVIRTLRGQCEVEQFYYILPEAYVTDLTQYDALVIPCLRQFGHVYYVLYNDTKQQLEAMDLVVLGYYPYISARIAAFSDGYIDTSLWSATDAWAEDFKNNTVKPEHSTLEAYEQCMIELHGLGYSDDVVLHHISPKSDEVAQALDYVKPFNYGVFIPQELQDAAWSYYRRYINGYPTNETVYISSNQAYHSTCFTDAVIAVLPDLAEGLRTVNEAYDAGEILPPHLKGWEDLRFIKYAIMGWYAYTDNGSYAVIRVSWTYSDDSQKNWEDKLRYDDQYYVLESGYTDWQSIEYQELISLLGEPFPDFVIHVDGYDDGGRIIENDILIPMA